MKLKPYLIVFALFLSLFTTSCTTPLDPAGPYAGDQTLYTADQTIALAYETFDTFLLWERTNEAVVSPTLHAYAEKLRTDAPGWFQSANTLRGIYTASPTSENQNKLTIAVGVLRAALSQVTAYMIESGAKKTLKPI
jgi:hypothetical protein